MASVCQVSTKKLSWFVAHKISELSIVTFEQPQLKRIADRKNVARNFVRMGLFLSNEIAFSWLMYFVESNAF